jgi:hypothetical protein
VTTKADEFLAEAEARYAHQHELARIAARSLARLGSELAVLKAGGSPEIAIVPAVQDIAAGLEVLHHELVGRPEAGTAIGQATAIRVMLGPGGEALRDVSDFSEWAGVWTAFLRRLEGEALARQLGVKLLPEMRLRLPFRVALSLYPEPTDDPQLARRRAALAAVQDRDVEVSGLLVDILSAADPLPRLRALALELAVVSGDLEAQQRFLVTERALDLAPASPASSPAPQGAKGGT